MNGTRCVACLVGYLWLAGVAAPAAAEEPQADQVILYEGYNFLGASLTYKLGDQIPDLDRIPQGSWNARVSSIKVGADVILKSWSGPRYGGLCMAFFGAHAGGTTGAYHDLRSLGPYTWDNLMRSLRVLRKGDRDAKCR